MIRKKIKEKNQKRFSKVLVLLLVALFVAAFLFLPNVVFAANESVQNEVYISWVSEVIKIFSHIVYVFIRPCLTIAGAALDNSLIYGSVLHLDAALWNIWNIMKNFANFTLWFIFVFTIVKNLFAWSFGNSAGDPIKGAKDTIVKTLIAWVLVQMSWFVVAALIDLSTILIYAVWWIPLSMLWSYNQDVSEIPIMKLNAEFNGSDISYYYSYWEHNFSQCALANKEWDVDDNIPLPSGLTWEYIAWRKYMYMPNGWEFDSWYCVLNWYLYRYQESTGFRSGTDFFTGYQASGDSVSVKNSLYLSQLTSYWKESSWQYLLDQRDSCSLVRAYNKEYTWWSDGECQEICPWFWEVHYTWDEKDVVFSESVPFTLKQLMENSKWWVWPFVTMYSSILRYQDLLIDPWNYSVAWNFFWLLLNTFFAVALFIPIAILMVLLIIRIGYLWVVVAISPIIVLVNFGVDEKIKKRFKLISEKFSTTEIIRLIFAPVVVVFTVSLCIVFLATIFRSKPNHDNEATTLSAFWIERVGDAPAEWDSGGGWQNSCNQWWEKKVNKETYSILWVATVTLEAQNYNHWLSMFARVLVEFLATAMVWFFMKFAIWVMWKKWEDLMKSAQSFIESVPIIPLPGGKWSIGIGKMKDVNPSAIINRYTNKLNTESDSKLRERFPWAYPWSSKPKNPVSQGVSAAEIDSVVKEINDSMSGGKPAPTYENLSNPSKEILTKMYGNNAKDYYDQWHFRDYYVTNATANNTLIEAGEKLPSSPTNTDAINFTLKELTDSWALQYDANWINWLKNMKWKFVELKDKVYVVSQDGTSLQTMQQYEIANFDNHELKDITKTIYDNFDGTKKQLLQNYIKGLLEEINAFEDSSIGTNRKASLGNSSLPAKSTVDGYKTRRWIS